MQTHDVDVVICSLIAHQCRSSADKSETMASSRSATLSNESALPVPMLRQVCVSLGGALDDDAVASYGDCSFVIIGEVPAQLCQHHWEGARK